MRTFEWLCLSMLAPVSVLAAELVVVESTSPNYELAQIINDTDTVVLEQGTEIILISEDGLVIGLVGPFDGPLTPIDSAGGYDALRALGVLVGQAEVDARSIVGVRFGGAQYSEIDPILELEDGRDTPWMVHVGIGGTQCVPLDVEPIVYWREDDSNDQRLNVRHLASGGSVTIDWQAGERTLAWPQQLPVSHDQVCTCCEWMMTCASWRS